MSNPTLTFYFAPGSSSMAVHIALWEVNAEFDPRPLSFSRGEHRTHEYLAINPVGQVPTLVVDGQPLTEVAAILFYLAVRFPASRLLPTSDVGQAQVISWMSFIAATVHPARRQGWERVREVYQLIERKLDRREWAVDSYSIADIHLFRLYWRIRNAFQPDPSEFPGLESHYHRVLARPAVQKTCAIERAIGYELRGWRDTDD